MQYDSSSLARLDAFESRVSHLINDLSSRPEFDENFSRAERKEKNENTWQ